MFLCIYHNYFFFYIRDKEANMHYFEGREKAIIITYNHSNHKSWEPRKFWGQPN